ncbi:MAG TPA: hypothetical protein VK655_11335 [Solirubrobacteraceae bacterium]|nr:hypothetical protein [Solirubrobacteraceae bacterium]
MLLLLVAGAWVFSHVSPGSLGECKHIALSIGSQPTITECQPLGTSDFLVPVVILTVLLLVVSSDGDLTINIPWLGEVKRTQRAKEAVKVAESPADQEILEQKAGSYLETVPARPEQ